MTYKKNRELKVYGIYGRNYAEQPQIKLQGGWLSALGFDIGTPINVECEDGRLIITLSNEHRQPSGDVGGCQNDNYKRIEFD